MENIYAKFKKILFGLLSVRMIYNGYVRGAAAKWKRSMFSNLLKDWNTNIFYKIKSYCLGYMPFQRKIFNINNDNKNEFLSYKKYLYLNGANGKYSKWLSDIITSDKVFSKFKSNFQELYYQLYLRDNDIKIIALKKDLEEKEESLINLIKKRKTLILMSSNYTESYKLCYKNSNFYLDDNKKTKEKLISFIKERLLENRSFVVIEDVVASESFRIDNENSKLYLTVYNKDGVNPEIGEVYASVSSNYLIDNEFGLDNINEEYILESYSVKKNTYYFENEEELNKSMVYFDEKTGKFLFCAVQNNNEITFLKKAIKEKEVIKIVENNYEEVVCLIKEMFKTVPQIEIAGVELTFTDKGIKILNIINNPPYCQFKYFSKDFDKFLKYKYEQKRILYKNFMFKFKIFRKKVWLKLCKLFAILCYPKGLVPYISFRWLRDIKDDFIENKNIPLSRKLWAYRHGFLSYRLAQYGITKDNYKNYISDFEYKWLRHIDNYYKVWFEDKVTIKYVASKYNKFFPKYYYFISLKQGQNAIIPLMDCPKNYNNTYDDIFNLVKKEKDIALKRDKGSHGEGFYRLSYRNSKFYLNLEETTKEEVIKILSDKNNEYLVTEYIKQHDVLNEIYDGSVNTIRIIVYKKDGKTPTIGNAYMRFGSQKTGTVDNIGAGGIFVNLDEETGYFHDALIITDDRQIVPCPVHPDSKKPIEGYIPNWDQILKDILEIANHLEQIEYFGFDIAITDKGMKFPEINRYPDYMKIGRLKQHSIDYLLERLETKKRKYGYDKKMPHKLFKFIDRRENR